jgi:ribosomal protein S18 acetylase RimI-like enzyme
MGSGKGEVIAPFPVISGGRAYSAAETAALLQDFARLGLRRAEARDAEALSALEAICFPSDLYGEHILSRRQFSYFISRANGLLIIHERDAQLSGYALLLFNRRSRIARLYSLAVSPDLQGQGLGRLLLEATERVCLRMGCSRLTLEIRADNKAALQRYIRLGYKTERVVEDYFPGHTAAIKLAVSARDVLASRYPDEKKA